MPWDGMSRASLKHFKDVMTPQHIIPKNLQSNLHDGFRRAFDYDGEYFYSVWNIYRYDKTY